MQFLILAIIFGIFSYVWHNQGREEAFKEIKEKMNDEELANLRRQMNEIRNPKKESTVDALTQKIIEHNAKRV